MFRSKIKLKIWLGQFLIILTREFVIYQDKGEIDVKLKNFFII